MTDKLPTKTKKTRSAQKSEKITPKCKDKCKDKRKSKRKEKQPVPETDNFTLLCNSNFGAECIREFRFYKPRMWRFDYAMPLYKIAIEVEGGIWTRGRHIRPQGFLNDIEKYNTATLLGWRVFRTTPDKLLSGKTVLLLKNAISGAFLHKNTLFSP